MRKILLTAATLVFVCMYLVQPSFAAGTVKWIILHNTTSTMISGVFFSETNSDRWGTDFLGEGYIYPGDQHKFYVRSNSCRIDMKTRFVNGVEHTLQFNICSAEHIDDLPDKLIVAY